MHLIARFNSSLRLFNQTSRRHCVSNPIPFWVLRLPGLVEGKRVATLFPYKLAARGDENTRRIRAGSRTAMILTRSAGALVPASEGPWTGFPVSFRATARYRDDTYFSGHLFRRRVGGKRQHCIQGSEINTAMSRGDKA